MGLNRIFFPSVLQLGQSVGLNPQAVKHIQVLRLQPGKSVVLFDGEGFACVARIEDMGKQSVEVTVTELLPAWPLPACESHLLISMPANERMDWLVEKATELGVARITPLMSERSVVRLSSERAIKRHHHWTGVAQAACSQSGRNRIPRIDMPVDFSDALQQLSSSSTKAKVLLSFAQTAKPWRDLWLTPPTSIAFLCGPEGGLSAQEELLACQHGFVPASLGLATLRSETAAISVLAQLL